MGCVKSDPKPKNMPLPTNTSNIPGDPVVAPPPAGHVPNNALNIQNNSGIYNSGGNLGYAAQQYPNVVNGAS